MLRTLVGAMGRREHQRRRTARGTEGITGTPGAPHTELHAGHTKEQDRRALNEPSSGQGPHTATAAPERRQTRNAPGNAGSVSRQRCPPRGGARPGPPLTAAAPRRPLGLVVPRPAAPRRHRPPRTTGPGAPRARPRGSGSGRKAAARPGHPAAAMSSARESQSHHGLKRAASPDVTGRGAAARREGLGGAGGGGGGRAAARPRSPRRDAGRPGPLGAGGRSERVLPQGSSSWEAADLGNEERKQKFLRLMGAAKVRPRRCPWPPPGAGTGCLQRGRLREATKTQSCRALGLSFQQGLGFTAVVSAALLHKTSLGSRRVPAPQLRPLPTP